MKLLPLLLSALATACASAIAAPAAAGELLYTLERSVTLPSTDTGYDYIKMQPGTARLFMARLADGLTVFDVNAGKARSGSWRIRTAPTGRCCCPSTTAATWR